MRQQSRKPTAAEFLFRKLFVGFAVPGLDEGVRTYGVALQRRKLTEQIIEVSAMSEKRAFSKAEEEKSKSKEPAAKYKPADPAWQMDGRHLRLLVSCRCGILGWRFLGCQRIWRS